ncbi:Predicted transcriptional regulator YdeE, contains AraC-type DNA-binding domain [Paenibacillaceae bacterium GAS479]|nr:Predicted transcriptional regulator YdeE, contains AraC-type DNA-binding domain [Paenibacillaceae bacterium GAS479]
MLKTYVTEKPQLRLRGISLRTTNAAEAGPDGRLPGLWEAYFSSTVQRGTEVPAPIYSLYTDYESDASGSYRVLIGHEVDGDFETGEDGQASTAVVPASKYLVFITKRGPMHEVVPQAWGEIWAYFDNAPEEVRAFTGDFELYDTGSAGFADSEVHIFIAIK